MTREELLEKKKRLEADLALINEDLARLNDMIRKDKIKKVCDLLKELSEYTDEDFEIQNYIGEVIEIDLEDIYESIRRHFNI